MCCCGQPNINGTPGYRWQPNDPPRVRPVNPPDLAEGDTLLFDEPGRCGGLDGHAHHFRLVKSALGGMAILVRHGGGDERIGIECTGRVAAKCGAFSNLTSDQRYWLLYSMYSIHREATTRARDTERGRWANAFVEKRIKRRKRQGAVKVWIEDATAVPREA